MDNKFSTLTLKYLGIDTYKDPVIYMRSDCYICQAEGFKAPARVEVFLNGHSLIATLNTVESNLLHHDEASLSHYAWEFLQAKEGDTISISHPKHLESISYIHSKLYGNELNEKQMHAIIEDVVTGQLSDIHIAMFLASTTGNRLNHQEVLSLTQSMVETGEKIVWPNNRMIVDKHCVGGLPGNRTTLIVVPIVAAFGLTIPKTSSRAITSPAGSADTMEIFAPVNLDIPAMRKVVEQENGCIIWGGSVALSPADDLLIGIEKTMDLDSEGQMVASILSKKIAAGTTHLVIDMPVGPTAKVRSLVSAEYIKKLLEDIAKEFSIQTRVIFTDGIEPVGRGIGPALEAKDVWAVLSNDANAPTDLRDRALTLAGHLLEFSPDVKEGQGKKIATEILNSKKALHKFIAICKAQGGLYEIPEARYQRPISAKKAGKIISINNRHIAHVAKLAGAPNAPAAGVELLVKLNSFVEKGQSLFVIHAEHQGELEYALAFLEQRHDIFEIEEYTTK
ncbi:MAG: thymidine phosphorylase family protein [Legionellales bacterium]